MSILIVIDTNLKWGKEELAMEGRSPKEQLMQALKEGNHPIFTSLLKANMDLLNQPIDNNGNTLLHLAAQHSQVSIAKSLCTTPGINYNAENADDQTPRDLCTAIINDSYDNAIKKQVADIRSNIVSSLKQGPIVEQRQSRSRAETNKLAKALDNAGNESAIILKANQIANQTSLTSGGSLDTNILDEYFDLQNDNKSRKIDFSTHNRSLTDRLISVANNLGPDNAKSLLKRFSERYKTFLKKNPELGEKIEADINANINKSNIETKGLGVFVQMIDNVPPNQAMDKINKYKADHGTFLMGNKEARDMITSVEKRIRRNSSHIQRSYSDAGISAPKQDLPPASLSAPAASQNNNNKPVTSQSANIQTSEANRRVAERGRSNTLQGKAAHLRKPVVPTSPTSAASVKKTIVIPKRKTASTEPTTPPPSPPRMKK